MPPFASLVRDQVSTLTPSERRLVSAVMAAPREAALGSVTALARDVGVHEATVSRLARKLGFDGYAAFRQALQAEFIPSAETATRLTRTVAQSDGAGVLAALVAREVAGLTSLLAHVREPQVAEAAERLMRARRVHLFGRGNAEVLARMMERRLRRFGRDVQHLGGDGRDLAEQALGFREGDALLLYAFRRQPRHYAPLVRAARDRGAATLAISGTLGPLLDPAPDLLLAAPRSGDAETFQTLTVPMAISNAVVIACAARADPAALKALDDLGPLIERFD